MACELVHANNLHFLELPVEIRIKIYEIVFTGSNIYIQLIGDNLQTSRLHIHGGDIGIVLTCRQIYQETSSEWYTANLWTLGFPPALGFFLRSTCSESLARVTRLTIQIHELPDLNTKLLPSLELLVIDFTTDLPTFMSGKWHDYDDDKVYSRFSDEAIARVHSTFKVLITQLHEENRSFHLGLVASVCGRPYGVVRYKKQELYVNLDTKLVERRLTDPYPTSRDETCWEDEKPKDLRTARKLSISDSWGLEDHQDQDRRPLNVRRAKCPPGRETNVADDEDQRGSTRASEQDSSDEDSEEVDDDQECRVDWEDVKRIIEHPSEDEQSLDGDDSEEEASESQSLRDGVDHAIEDAILGPTPINPEPEPEPEQEQEQEQEQERPVSADAFRGENIELSIQVSAVSVDGD